MTELATFDAAQPLLRLYQEQFAQRVADGYPATTAYREVMNLALVNSNEGSNGTLWLKLPHVQARVRYLIAQKLEAAEVTGDKVVREIARIAFSDVRKVFDPEDGTPLAPHLLDDATAAAVASIHIERIKRGDEWVTVYKYKFHAKNDMLGLLGKRFKLVEDSGSDLIDNLTTALADKLNAAKRRMSKETKEVEDAEWTPVKYTTPVEEVEDLAGEHQVVPDPEQLW